MTAKGSQQHRRTSRNLISLTCGLSAFLTFAEEVGTIDTVERERLWTRGLAAFRAVGGNQDANQASENPVHRFIDLVRSAVASGKAHVAGPDGNRPENPEAWGWRCDSAGSDQYVEGWRPQGTRIGWVDGDPLYLDPNASYAAAQALGRDVGDTISLQPRTLHKRLNEAGLLLSTDQGRGHLTVRRTLGGTRLDVLHLSSNLFPETAQSAQPARQAGVPEPRGPLARAGSAGEEGANGPDAGPEAAHVGGDTSTSGTVGPNGPIHPREEDIVSVMQHLVDTGALIDHAPIRLGPGVVARDVDQAVRAELLSARHPGLPGQAARDRWLPFTTS